MEARTIDGHEYHFTLGDDGTLDTVVEVFDVSTGKTETLRYNSHISAFFRDAEGILDFDRFIDDDIAPWAAAFDWGDSPAPEDCLHGDDYLDADRGDSGLGGGWSADLYAD